MTAIGLMMGIAKPANALKRIGAILGIVIVLTLMPSVLLGAWSGMALWQQVALVANGVGVWRLKQWGTCASRTKRR